MKKIAVFIITLSAVLSFTLCSNTRNKSQQVYTGLKDFSEGYAAFQVNDRWGYLDHNLNEIIQPQFHEAGQFKNGIASVKLVNKTGYIDTKGKYVIKPVYADGGEYSEGLIPVKIGNDWGYIDIDGKVVIEPQFDIASSFSGGYAAVKDGGHWGYIDKDGKIVINLRFESAGKFVDGLAPVQTSKNDNEWGYIDKKGKFMIMPQFDDALPFSGGYAAVNVDERWGFINSKGKIIINPRFMKTENFSHGNAAVKLGETWGYINQDEKTIIEPRLLNAGPFSDGFALVTDGAVMAYMTAVGTIDGRVVVQLKESDQLKNTMFITVKDYFTGKGVPGVQIWKEMWTGWAKSTLGVTDENGKFTKWFEIVDSSRIYIPGDGDYYYASAPPTLFPVLVVARKDAPKINVKSVMVTSKPSGNILPYDVIDSYDVLKERAEYMWLESDTVDIKIDLDTRGWRIRKYRLVQNGGKEKVSDSPRFENLKPGLDFDAGDANDDKQISLIIETDMDYGNVVVPLKLYVKPNPKYPNPVSTDKVKVSTVYPKEIPFVGNDKIDISGVPFINVGAYYEEGKLTIVFGPNISGDKEGLKKWSRTLKEYPGTTWIPTKGNIKKQVQALKSELAKGKGVLSKIKSNYDWAVGGQGFIELDLEHGGKVLSSKMAIIGSAEVNLTFRGFISIVPVYVKVGLGGDIMVSFAVYDSRSDSWFSNPNLGIDIYAYIEAGAGIPDFLSVGGGGRITVHTEADFKGHFPGSLTLAAYFKVTAFVFFTYETTLAEHTWPWGGAGIDMPPKGDPLSDGMFAISAENMANLYNTDKLQLMDRSDYGFNESNFLGGKLVPGAAGAYSTESLIVKNVIPGCIPQILKYGDSEVLLWIGDNPKRNNENRTTLYSAFRKGDGKFSDPVAVHDDGTADLDFAAAVYQDTLIVTWQNTSKPLPKFNNGDVNILKEYLKVSEIYTAVYDARKKKWNTPLRNTTNDYYDGKPQCYSRNGEGIAIAWVSNTESDVFFKDGKTEVHIMVGPHGGVKEWSESSFEPDKGMLVNYSFALQDNFSKIRVALDCDRDKNLATTKDRDIWEYSRSEGSSWKDRPVSSHENIESHPAYGYFNGNLALFWYCDGDIKYWPSSDSGRLYFLELKDQKVSDDFSLVMDDKGVAGIIWTSRSDDGYSEAYISTYDQSNGKWFKPAPVTSSDRHVQQPSGFKRSDGTYVISYRKSFSTDDGKDSDKHWDLCVSTKKSAPDLSTRDIYSASARQVADNPFYYGITVFNEGVIPVKGIKLESLDDRGRSAWSKNFPDISLNPGESKVIEGEYRLPSSLKKHNFTVKAAPISGANAGFGSAASYTVGIPDIRIARVLISHKGKTREASITVESANWVPVDNVTVEVYKQEYKKENLVKTIPVGTVGNGNTGTAVFTYSVDEMGDQKSLPFFFAAKAPKDELEGIPQVAVMTNPYYQSALNLQVTSANGIQKDSNDKGIISTVIGVSNNQPKERSDSIYIEILDANNNVKDKRKVDVKSQANGTSYISAEFLVNSNINGWKVRAKGSGEGIETPPRADAKFSSEFSNNMIIEDVEKISISKQGEKK